MVLHQHQRHISKRQPHRMEYTHGIRQGTESALSRLAPAQNPAMPEKDNSEAQQQ